MKKSKLIFLTLKIDEKLYKINFIDKQEFKLKKGNWGHFQMYEKHPLLLNFNENILITYLNSKPADSQSFVKDLENTINAATGGYRSWKIYFEDILTNFKEETFQANVKSGFGKLFEAPFSITQKALEVCTKHSIKTITFGGDLKQENYKLICIDNNYVIAKEFELHLLI